jgi:glycosyltransferase involved in cell wall biosynthesis
VQPLVTVGVPTYNRGALSERAVRSALDQDYSPIEVVVSDDASTDDTSERFARLAQEDPRVRYMRQPANLGHARNFQAVLDAARGDYFMWLSDDDWIDAAYVSRCLAVLEAHAGYSLVGGLPRYYSNGHHVVDERPTNLLSTRPGLRVLAYLARVNVNGALFGVARRADLQRLAFKDEVGGDWLLVAGLAAQGRVRTLPTVHIHRSIEGLSSDEHRLARSFGMRGLLARHHHFAVAGRFAREIVASPHYGALTRLQRVVAGSLAAILIVLRFPVQALLRRLLQALGLGGLEARAIAWVRSRD